MQNKLYDHAMQQLITAENKKNEIEKNFNQSKLGAYEEICKNRLNYATELLNMGVACELKNDEIIILTDSGDIITFSSAEIKEKLGKEKYEILFPETAIEDDDTLFDESFDEIEESVIMPEQMNNPLSPFVAAIQTLLTPQTPRYPIAVPTVDPVKAVEEYVNSSKAIIEKQKNKIRMLTTENHQYKISSKQYDEEAEKIKSNIDALNKDNVSLKEKCDDLTRKNEALSREINDSKTHIDKVVHENDSYVHTLSEKDEEIEKLTAQVKKAVDNDTAYNESLQKLTNEKNELENTLNERSKDVNELTSKNKQLNTEIAELKKKNAENNEEEYRKLLEEKNLLKKKLDISSEQIKELRNSFDNSASGLKEIAELFEVKNQNDKNEILSVATALKKQVEALKKQNDELLNALYIDKHFKIGNINSFEKKFFKDKEKIELISVVQIKNLFDINTVYSESAGDRVIELTLEALTKNFGKENVFRIRGAQFVVLFKDGNKAQIDKKLYAVKKYLKENRDIIICYGLSSVADNDRTREDSLNIAKEELNALMSGKVSPKDVSASITQNKNIDSSLLTEVDDSDPYKDENVIEEDGTSVDMASLLAGLSN